MEKTTNIDWFSFNKRIAGLRGEKWRKKLIKNKLFRTEFPTAMKHRRVNEGLSQKDMIGRVGIKVLNTYGRIERGEGYAKKDVAEKIAKTLGTDVNEIFIEAMPGKFLAI